MRVSKIHILTFARHFGVLPDNVELDYIQNWVLFGLSQTDAVDTLAFKGGTCLKKIYFKDYRFSKDLDFTLIKDLSIEELRSTIEKSIEIATDGCGVYFYIDEFKSYERMVYVKIKWKSIQSGRDRKLEMNVTVRNEFLTNDYPKMLVIHEPYSSIEKDYHAELSCYTLEEILAEKIRTLFERKGRTGAWPRDLYDVWMLIRRGDINLEKMLRILTKKLEIRDIKINVNKLIERKNVLSHTWQSSLKDVIPGGKLPEFNRIFSDVVEFIHHLEEELK
jgi:predicted nucleotidyltransferase component of viral defense system